MRRRNALAAVQVQIHENAPAAVAVSLGVAGAGIAMKPVRHNLLPPSQKGVIGPNISRIV